MLYLLPGQLCVRPPTRESQAHSGICEDSFRPWETDMPHSVIKSTELQRECKHDPKTVWEWCFVECGASEWPLWLLSPSVWKEAVLHISFASSQISFQLFLIMNLYFIIMCCPVYDIDKTITKATVKVKGGLHENITPMVTRVTLFWYDAERTEKSGGLISRVKKCYFWISYQVNNLLVLQIEMP